MEIAGIKDRFLNDICISQETFLVFHPELFSGSEEPVINGSFFGRRIFAVKLGMAGIVGAGAMVGWQFLKTVYSIFSLAGKIIDYDPSIGSDVQLVLLRILQLIISGIFVPLVIICIPIAILKPDVLLGLLRHELDLFGFLPTEAQVEQARKERYDSRRDWALENHRPRDIDEARGITANPHLTEIRYR